MTLRASSYTYAEPTDTQRLADFVGATVRGFEYFGCVPDVLVPDVLVVQHLVFLEAVDEYVEKCDGVLSVASHLAMS
jgi:transposase